MGTKANKQSRLEQNEENYPHTNTCLMTAQAAEHAASRGLPSGLHTGQGAGLAGQGPGVSTQTVLNQIAQRFFLHLAQSPEHVLLLTQQLERIASVLTTGYAVGCLEMRLRVAASSDLRRLRRLVDSGVLQETVERALLTDEQRDWLRKQTASFGLTWRQFRLKVTIAEEDLARCERFLRAREEMANPRNAAEALLQKAAAVKMGETGSGNQVRPLPDLVVSFLDWLVHVHPALAEKAATILVTFPLNIGITETMTVCRQHFRLSNIFQRDLAVIASAMLQNVSCDTAVSAPETHAAQELLKPTALYIEVPPGSPLAKVVHKLSQAKLMIPHEVPQKEHAFRFPHLFVADFALTSIAVAMETLPEDYVSKALQAGSPFTVLHFVDLLMNSCLPVEHFRSDLASGAPLDRLLYERVHMKESASVDNTEWIVTQQLLQSLSHSHPRPATDLYLACCPFIRYPDCTALLQKWWWNFGKEWKGQLRAMLGSGSSSGFPEILLCPLSDGEVAAVRETAEQVLSATHTMDLSDKLTHLTQGQLRVVLACVQLTNVTNFRLVEVGRVAALRVTQDGKSAVITSVSTGQPALKLCKNHLGDMHVQCLLDALPGLESVSHLDLSSCTMSHANLQRLLTQLHVTSMKTLILNGISFTDSRVPILPSFSHLRRLQGVELSFLGLQDSIMPQLAEQIRELPDLRELGLERNPITTEGLSQLTRALAPCSSLRVLRLAGCQLDAGGAFVLGAVLTSAVALHVLDISQCPLQDSGLQHLTVALKNHTLLSKVSLSGGGYSADDLYSFFTHLTKCQLMQHLELANCPIEKDGCDVSDRFLRALAGSCQWNYLGLWKCRIGHTAFLQQLATLSTQLRGLTSLVLQDNNLEDEQVGHLTGAVRQGVFLHLKQLNLSQNNIGETGAKQLAEVLPFLPHLSHLLMQCCAVPMDGAISLARAALRLPNMTLLNLTNSMNMSYHDIIETVTEIERIVREEEIVVGLGVHYTEHDVHLEWQFIADKLGRLHLGHVELGSKEQAPGDDTDTGTLLKTPESPMSVTGVSLDTTSQEVSVGPALPRPVDLPGEETKVPVSPEPIHRLPPKQAGDDVVSVEPALPQLEELSSGMPEVSRRMVSARDGDSLFFDGHLCISLARHATK